MIYPESFIAIHESDSTKESIHITVAEYDSEEGTMRILQKG